MGMFDGGGIVKKQLVLFFVVDTSGSMYGEKIGAVNTAIREALNDSEFKTAGGADAEILIAILEFNNDCKWHTQVPVPIDSVQWRDLDADGGTSLGEACKELSKKLDKNAFLNAPGGSAAPVIILLSDGEPTDDFDHGIAILKQNKYYKQTIRLACAIGDDADADALAEFTGSRESVLRVHSPEALKKWIRVVSLTASKVGSKSQPTTDGTVTPAQNTAVTAVINATQNDPIFIEDENSDGIWN
ncbi:MAG: VWA domain-containing protein [Spirochaetaceae bacterium]|jgi:uncharacterized protein YegL|nr:VWA domain-containing protein [Spirochaetaceae bacterium]